ncbi:MAG: hypothetical protein ACYDHP_07965 [Ferrimicrobium sp.]
MVERSLRVERFFDRVPLDGVVAVLGDGGPFSVSDRWVCGVARVFAEWVGCPLVAVASARDPGGLEGARSLGVDGAIWFPTDAPSSADRVAIVSEFFASSPTVVVGDSVAGSAVASIRGDRLFAEVDRVAVVGESLVASGRLGATTRWEQTFRSSRERGGVSPQGSNAQETVPDESLDGVWVVTGAATGFSAPSLAAQLHSPAVMTAQALRLIHDHEVPRALPPPSVSVPAMVRDRVVLALGGVGVGASEPIYASPAEVASQINRIVESWKEGEA